MKIKKKKKTHLPSEGGTRTAKVAEIDDYRGYDRGTNVTMPRLLHRAIKDEARASGMTASQAYHEGMTEWLRKRPTWREFLIRKGNTKTADERGAIREPKPKQVHEAE